MIISIQSFDSLLFRVDVAPILNKERLEHEHLAEDATEDSTNNQPVAPHLVAPEFDQVNDNSFLDSVTMEEEALQQRQYTNLVEVLRAICLHPGRCIHQKMEFFQLNPFSSDAGLSFDERMRGIPNCGDACWQCKDDQHTVSLNRPIKLTGLRIAVLDITIHRSPQIEKLKLDATGLARTMTTYSDSHGKTFAEIVFGKKKQSHKVMHFVGLLSFVCLPLVFWSLP